MKILLAIVLCLAFLTGCPGVGNVKHGHVPPGQVR